MEETTATQPATEPTTEETPRVENPEGVLKKNQELLAKLNAEKTQREQLAAKIAQYEAAEAERQTKALEKKGEWETLRQNMEESHKQALTERESRYTKLFENSSRYELAVEIGKHEVFEGKAERLAKLLLLEAIRPVEEEGRVVWRRLDTDEQVNLGEFIPTLKDAYGEFFKADNNPGSNAPGSTGRSSGGSLRRSQMDTKAKVEYVKKHGQEAFLKLPQ